jgi:hypothetical protein
MMMMMMMMMLMTMMMMMLMMMMMHGHIGDIIACTCTQDSLIVKNLMFEFVNNYFTLFFIAFLIGIGKFPFGNFWEVEWVQELFGVVRAQPPPPPPAALHCMRASACAPPQHTPTPSRLAPPGALFESPWSQFTEECLNPNMSPTAPQ